MFIQKRWFLFFLLITVTLLVSYWRADFSKDQSPLESDLANREIQIPQISRRGLASAKNPEESLVPNNAYHSNLTLEEIFENWLTEGGQRVAELYFLSEVDRELGDDINSKKIKMILYYQILKRNKIHVDKYKVGFCKSKNESLCVAETFDLIKAGLERLSAERFSIQKHLLLEELASLPLTPAQKISIYQKEFFASAQRFRDPQSSLTDKGHFLLDDQAMYAQLTQKKLMGLSETPAKVIRWTMTFISKNTDQNLNVVLASNLFKRYPSEAVYIGQALLAAGMSEEDVLFSIQGPQNWSPSQERLNIPL